MQLSEILRLSIGKLQIRQNCNCREICDCRKIIYIALVGKVRFSFSGESDFFLENRTFQMPPNGELYIYVYIYLFFLLYCQMNFFSCLLMACLKFIHIYICTFFIRLKNKYIFFYFTENRFSSK